MPFIDYITESKTDICTEQERLLKQKDKDALRELESKNANLSNMPRGFRLGKYMLDVLIMLE